MEQTFPVGSRVAAMAGPLRKLVPNTGTVIPWEGEPKAGASRVQFDAGPVNVVSNARLFDAEEDDD